MEPYAWNQGWVEHELAGVVLPDQRYRANLFQITEHLASHIGCSFSAACGERLRKSACRLFSHRELDLLSAHQHCTAQRCAGTDGEVVLVVEDTTALVYNQKGKAGLGPLGGIGAAQSRGLYAHSALALSAADGQVLGILHQKIWAPKEEHGPGKTYLYPIEEKESFKWLEVLRAANSLLSGSHKQVFVIGDREADFFEHYSEPRANGVELLVRVQQKKRKVFYQGELLPVSEVLPRLSPLGSGVVKVWRRKYQKERIAAVNYYCGEVVLPPTYRQQAAEVPMRLLYVKERGAGCAASDGEAVEWVLLTTARATGLSDVVRQAGYYARRWVVERFHYILKSGLGIERLQMHDAASLRSALQLYSLVAWHVLALHRMAHGSAANQAAAEHIDAEIIEIVEATVRSPVARVVDFALAVGRLGGFRPSRKQPLPGEKTLWSGLRQLQAIILGFNAAKEKYGTG